jgi:HEAT repeat protein
LLKSKDNAVRRDAARAIGDSGYGAAIPALDQIASDAKESEEVRLFSATAAAKLGSAESLKILAELLKSAKPEIRSRAVFALGKYGGAGQAKQLEFALADSDRSVREDAVEALRLLGKDESLGPLIKAVSDDDHRIRKAAMDALREISKQHLENDPEAWKLWWAKRQPINTDAPK